MELGAEPVEALELLPEFVSRAFVLGLGLEFALAFDGAPSAPGDSVTVVPEPLGSEADTSFDATLADDVFGAGLASLS